MMELEDAKQIYADVEAIVGPYCEKIAVAGSVRRQRRFVNDIDIVAIPKMGTLRGTLPMLFDMVSSALNGPKMARLRYKGAQIDIYYATEETWATMLLIRTGSKESNIRLCSIAQGRSWKLHANGDGLFDSGGQRIAGDTEESIFRALGVAYLEPWER